MGPTVIRFRSDRLSYWWSRRKDRWRAARWDALGKRGSFLFEVQPGVRLRLYGDSELCRLIYCRNFERTERDFINRFLRPGDVFVDVGANIGLFALIAGARVGSTGRVIAFEPAASTYERLTENVRRNQLSSVICLNMALSNEEGTASLVSSIDGYDAWNSLARPTMGDSFAEEPIAMTTWDGYAQEHGLVGKVRMMKIDVEGWETRVLSGGRRFFERPDAPDLQVEFAPGSAKSAGSSCEELYGDLESLGYELYAYDPERCALRPAGVEETHSYINLIAAKDADFVNARLRASKAEEL